MQHIAKLMVQRAKRKAYHAKGSNPLLNWWLVNTQFLIQLPKR